jgi:hypothetical protein
MTINQNPWDLSKSGPLITVQSEEFTATLMIAYRQDGRAYALVCTWEIDGDVTSIKLQGTNESWPEFWDAFLDVLPGEWQAGVAQCEPQVRY